MAVLILLLAAQTYAARPVEHYFRFEIRDRSELETLTRVISISRVDGNTVYAYASERQMAAFKKLDYPYRLLPHPGTLIEPEMAATLSQLGDWDTYPSYEQYETMMYQFQVNYPDLCVIENAGYTVQGRKILFAKISANVNTPENEPEVMYTSSMHGDEITGYVLMLRLIDSLLSSYGSDAQITYMLDNLEIWINPLANPDGTYITGNSSVSGAVRYNANGIDLNRNFPDPDEGDHPDGNAWQPETVVMMDFAAQHRFVISANFHGGAEVLNYPWDTWPRRHADDTWLQSICRTYADTAQAYSPDGYLDDLDNGITNGWDWYTISGGRQDFMTYWHGCREVTIEISRIKLVSGSSLPYYWDYNKVALLQYLRQSLFGIRGVVTDSQSGQPVAATLTVLNHDVDSSQVYTDPVVGDYHRMLAPGTYDLEFTAEGYWPYPVEDVTVTDGGIVYVDIFLTPDTSYVCGDIDGTNGRVDALDLIYFAEYLFSTGPPPPSMEAADVDGSDQVDALDLIRLVDYLFLSGPPPAC
ncbi:MAG: carboxypeptidase regulatory-like domain-containing protein [Candidatus Zixiibacteriota bacterium]|nr:MAG: carboxypeptidase regulatory-like domain-containing protein [candidate division Zixibacteria bacterium]